MLKPAVEIILPNSTLAMTLPQGWGIVDAPVPTLVGPENDIRVLFIVAAKLGSMEETARASCRAHALSFDLPVRAQGGMPSTNGWDRVHQIVYDTPAQEDRMLVAILRSLGDRVYINLIDATRAAFSRRMAQVSEMIDGWKPDGLSSKSLAGKQVPQWGPEQAKQLGDFVRVAMAALKIPGVSLAIVQGAAIVHTEGFGGADVRRSIPVTPETRFMIGSSTKPLTSLLMARLVDKGHFDWATPVQQVLPAFALADPDVTRRVEMRHTVCACTGMPRRDLDFIFKFTNVTPEQRLEEMKSMLPTTGFGETFQYSNSLVAAGGYAAAHSFEPELSLADAFSRAMNKLVFEPLGMSNTFLGGAEGGDKPLASPHALALDGSCAAIDPAVEHFADALAPAGSAWSTATDMAKYVLLELACGKDEKGEQVVSREQILRRREKGIKIDGNSSYGLGLIVTENQGLQVISHGGNTLGFSSDLYFLPDHDLGVVVLTNLRIANAFLSILLQKMLEILFDAEAKSEQMLEAAHQNMQESLKKDRMRITTDAASQKWLHQFVGEYRCKELGTARISDENGICTAQFESWSSDLGLEVDASGRNLIALTTPPWSGVRLEPTESGDELVIRGAQNQYTFHKEVGVAQLFP
jgi:CubicO group peptidase (beta-lactamase class C family)